MERVLAKVVIPSRVAGQTYVHSAASCPPAEPGEIVDWDCTIIVEGKAASEGREPSKAQALALQQIRRL